MPANAAAPTMSSPTDDERPQDVSHPAVMRAFSDVVEAITEDVLLDDLLHLVARKICDLLAIRRCSVYLQHGRSGLYRGQVGETGRDDDEAIKRLTAGGAADLFTQEIVETRAPVLIRDAQRDPRMFRSVMKYWGVRTMLGVPMAVRDDVIGILFLDNESEPYDFAAADLSLAETFANLAAVAITQAQNAAELRESVRTVARQNATLRQASAMEERFAATAVEGGGLVGITDSVTRATGKPCALYDENGHRLAVSRPAGTDVPAPRLLEPPFRQLPAIVDALAAIPAQRPAVVGPLPSAGLSHRYLVAPITARDEVWGHLVLMEYGSRLSSLDMLAVRRAASIIALEMSMTRRSATARADAHAALVRDVALGKGDPAAVLRGAGAAGIELDEAYAIGVLSGGGPLSAPQVEAGIRDVGLPHPVVVGAVDGTMTIIVGAIGDESMSRISGRFDGLAARLAGDEPLRIGLSSRCQGVGDGPEGFAEAQLALECLARTASPRPSGVMAADDLGVGRLLLGASERRSATRYAAQTLGPVLDSGEARSRAMLDSLEAFLRCNLSVRDAAQLLDVHENTVRYRLGRVQELTGLDVLANVDHQLEAQVALLVLRYGERRLALDPLPPSGSVVSRGRAAARYSEPAA